MVMLPILAAGLWASATMAGPLGVDEQADLSTCANADLTPDEHRLYVRQQQQRPAQANGGTINLPVSFAFCCPQPPDCPFDETAIMNEFYKEAGINWVLKNSEKITDDPRCQGLTLDNNKQQLESLKQETRRGGSEELNILYLPSNQGAGKKGECISPKPGSSPPPKVGNIVDSCVVALDTLPGQRGNGGRASRPSSQQGARGGAGGFPGIFRRQEEQGDADVGVASQDITSVHEAGHWLSLPHVGQGSGRGGFVGRRQAGRTGNVMEPSQVVGADTKYSFNSEQISFMREMAQKRIQKGNSTNGFDGGNGVRGGKGAGGGNFSDITGFPSTPESSPRGAQRGQGSGGNRVTPGAPRPPQDPTQGAVAPGGQPPVPGTGKNPTAGSPGVSKKVQSGPQGISGAQDIPGLPGLPGLDGSDIEILVADAIDLE